MAIDRELTEEEAALVARMTRNSWAQQDDSYHVADLDQLNEDLAPRYGVRLQMRVGVDTGDVVVSTLGDRGGAEFVVVGQTVNRASRLQSIAPPGGIMIIRSPGETMPDTFTLSTGPEPGTV